MGFTVDAGNTQRVPVGAGESVTVTTRRMAFVTAQSGLGLAPDSNIGSVSQGSTTYGPYPAGYLTVLALGEAAIVLNVPAPAGDSSALLGISAKPTINTPAVAGASISGTFAAVGNPTPSTAIAWLLNDAVISGATAIPYAAQASDAGKALKLRVTATNTNGTLVSTSDAVTVAQGSAGSAYATWQAALARVANGTGYAKVLLIGDSTTAGVGAGASPSRAQAPAPYLRDRLRATQSLPAVSSSWVGDQSFQKTNTISPYAYDARLTQPDGTGYAVDVATFTIAGNTLRNTSNANRLGFLPEEAVDTVDVYYPVFAATANFNITRVGATTVSVNQNGASGTGKSTLIGTLNSTDPIYISRTAGSTYLIGMDAWNSAVKSIRILQAGWSGGKVADWIVSATGFDPLPAAKAMACDLYLIRPGINDWATGATSLASFQASLETLVDGLLTVGNVALLTGYPSNISFSSQARQQSFVDVVKAVAAARNLKVDDTFGTWGTWEAANAQGYMADNLHPSENGYKAAAATCASFILGL